MTRDVPRFSEMTMTADRPVRIGAAVRRIAMAVSVAGLVACAGPERQVPKLDPARVQQFEAKGYPAAHQYPVSQVDELRVVQGRPFRLVWTRPQQAGPHPLVVYLPGAGQDALANESWRNALAQAGYAVLSWQALPDDEQRPQGDLRQWASQRFASDALQQRTNLLAQLMADLTRAQAAGEPGLQRVNLKLAALAGYDLGAYTAQWAAGEHVNHMREASASTLAGAFKAFIWLSPYASFSQGGFDTRYADLNAPILTITSDRDTDPFGLVSASYLRTAPFGGMPAGQKFMLMLGGASHDDLGGREGRERLGGDGDVGGRQGAGPGGKGGAEGSGPGGDGDGADGPGGSGGGLPPGGGRGGRGGGMGGSGGGGGHGGGPGGRGGPGGSREGRAVSPTQQAMQRAAVTTVSIAFLDAWLQDDALARNWLSEQAPRWLKPVGDLHGK
ncbi:MAG TPA: hypothetical protein H9903_03550 [Candidatus Aquabacterium excrementipullorum]|nr:hypothetical protein [Candidatus Aquabacterium excrementipullorum]